MPEFAAPALGNKNNLVTVEADIPANANGVLSYEYNLFEIERTHIKAKGKLPTGKVKIEVETRYAGVKRATGPLEVVLKVNGQEVASGTVPVSARCFALQTRKAELIEHQEPHPIGQKVETILTHTCHPFGPRTQQSRSFTAPDLLLSHEWV